MIAILYDIFHSNSSTHPPSTHQKRKVKSNQHLPVSRIHDEDSTAHVSRPGDGHEHGNRVHRQAWSFWEPTSTDNAGVIKPYKTRLCQTEVWKNVGAKIAWIRLSATFQVCTERRQPTQPGIFVYTPVFSKQKYVSPSKWKWDEGDVTPFQQLLYCILSTASRQNAQRQIWYIDTSILVHMCVWYDFFLQSLFQLQASFNGSIFQHLRISGDRSSASANFSQLTSSIKRTQLRHPFIRCQCYTRDEVKA